MITAIPRAHALYIAPLKHMHDTTTLPRIEPSSSTGTVIRGHLREKGRMTLQHILDCTGDRTADGSTARSSTVRVTLEWLVEIGAVSVTGKGDSARYSVDNGPQRDWDPGRRERAFEAGLARRCAEAKLAESTRSNRKRLLAMEGR